MKIQYTADELAELVEKDLISKGVSAKHIEEVRFYLDSSSRSVVADISLNVDLSVLINKSVEQIDLDKKDEETVSEENETENVTDERISPREHITRITLGKPRKASEEDIEF